MGIKRFECTFRETEIMTNGSLFDCVFGRCVVCCLAVHDWEDDGYKRKTTNYAEVSNPRSTQKVPEKDRS